MNTEAQIAIREIQHFAFCPHQWGLMYFENVWVSSYSIAKGDLLHEKVDDPFMKEKRGMRNVSRALPLYSAALSIHGVADYVEFVGDGGTPKITVTEYKATEPRGGVRITDADRIQIAAQTVCLAEMFGTDVNAAIYYGNTRKKYAVEITQSDRENLRAAVGKMREFIVRGEIPPIGTGQKCGGWSFESVCLPKTKRTKSAPQRISEVLGE
jgi:CRISPR-associated exonuclease Cas4